MATQVEICNIALSHVGAYGISSITESTKEARECKKFYSIALQATLEDQDWSFARKRLTMALLAATYSGWSYAYAFPTDCASPRYISDVTGTSSGTAYDIELGDYTPTDKVKYEIAVANDLSSKVILTDKATAELVYTAKVTDTNLFPIQFVDAFAAKLAAYLAQPLKGSPQLRASLIQLYGVLIANAKGVDANSDYKKERSTNTFVAAR